MMEEPFLLQISPYQKPAVFRKVQNRAEPPRDGDIFLVAEFYFHQDMTLRNYYLRFHKHVERGDDKYRIELKANEYEAVGVKPIKGSFESTP